MPAFAGGWRQCAPVRPPVSPAPLPSDRAAGLAEHGDDGLAAPRAGDAQRCCAVSIRRTHVGAPVEEQGDGRVAFCAGEVQRRPAAILCRPFTSAPLSSRRRTTDA
jgi:hypothetical protein